MYTHTHAHTHARTHTRTHTQVTKLELQFNHLEAIPASLLELPYLRELNLSHNKLTDLPSLPHWSSSLTTLDLSHNNLSTLPGHPDACSLEVLNVSHNKLDVVPQCICSFLTLCTLDLSYNSIAVIPEEMGILRNLTTLNLNGLSCVKRAMAEGEVLTKRVDEGTELPRNIFLHTSGNYHLKVVVLGEKGVGKSTLVKLLSATDCKKDPETVGIRIHKWTVHKGWPLVFNLWDFSHLDSHREILQCFLTTDSVYLVLFDARHSWDTVEDGLVPWLEVLAQRMEQSSVLIVGTHQDLLPMEQQEDMDLILKEVTRLADQYSDRLKIDTVLLVGLQDSQKTIELLKEAICRCALVYTVHGKPVLGKKVPSFYHKMREMAEDMYRVQERDPVMDESEYRRLIEDIGFRGVVTERELEEVAGFVSSTGPLLHCHAKRMCFVLDPGWLYSALCALIDDPAVSEGGLRTSQVILSVPHAQKHMDVLLSFLDQHSIMTTLSADLILIIPLLPSYCPENVCVNNVGEKCPYMRYILFETTPPASFWTRLLSTVVTVFPRVQSVADAQWGSCPLPVAGLGKAYDGTTHLCFWRTGMHYQDLEVAFRVESLSHSRQLTHERKEGVLIVVSSTDLGKKLIGRLVDRIMTLITDMDFQCGHAPCTQFSKAETIPCSTCIIMGRPLPFEFHFEHCLSAAIQQKEAIECDCITSSFGRSHKIALVDLAPDIVLADVENQYHLDFSLLSIQEDSMVAMGTYGLICSGTYRQSPVTIKRYTQSDSTFTFRCLRREALLLKTLDHPCIIRLVGICPQMLKELVLEHVPLGPLDLVLSRHKLHRVTLHRLASEVGAALVHLHKQKLVLSNLKASSILVWSLNPEQLCHCKLSCLDAAKSFGSFSGCVSEVPDKIFAPEVLQCNGWSRCDPKTDMFSFGMLLYHMVTGRKPYHNVEREKVLLAIRRGMRPMLETSCPFPFPYLIKLFQHCWEQDPSRRPTAEEAVQRLCLSSTQSVLNISNMKSHSLLLQSCCVVTRSDFASYNLPSQDTEVWFCLDGEEGTSIKTYSVHAMAVTKMNFVVENQVQTMSLCGDQVWVSSRAGVDCGCLDLFHIGSRERTHTFPTEEGIVSCITCSDRFVYCGTLEGKCLVFSRDLCSLDAPQVIVLSDHAVEGMVCKGNCLWVSTASSILFLDACKFVTTRDALVSKQGFLGQLRLSPDGGKVWSHRIGATYLSAWDIGQKCHLFDLEVQEHLKMISSCAEHDMLITAITFAADTIWVGMATGHILIFHNQEMLLWFHPYRNLIKFLVSFDDFMSARDSNEVMGTGGKEKCVISASSGFQWPNPHDKEDSIGVFPAMETLITWAAFPSNLCRQMNILDRRSAAFCEDHHFVAEMLQKGMFEQASCCATASTDVPTHSRPPPSDYKDSSEGLDGSVSFHLSYSYSTTVPLHFQMQH